MNSMISRHQQRLAVVLAIAMGLAIAWAGLKAPDWSNLATLSPYVVRLVQLLGLVAVVRSLFLMGVAAERHKTSGAGASGAVASKAFVHLMGGLAAFTAPWMAAVLAAAFSGWL